jgi:anti-anti-sigma regulatory factor
MGKYTQWVTHKGVRILFLKGANLEEAEYLAALDELKQEAFRDRTSAPVLMDLTNTAMTGKTTAKGKELLAATKAAGLQEGPMAVVGVSSVAKAVGKLFGVGSVHFDDSVDQAKEWLVKEAGKRRQSSVSSS